MPAPTPKNAYRNPLTVLTVGLVGFCLAAVAFGQEFPKPSPYPTSWELEFKHGIPRRVVVEVPGNPVPQAYWYVTYTVTNNTDQEQMFLPVFELLADDGQLVRGDKNIPSVVFDRIKERERSPLLEPFTKVAGKLLIGEDQARDGVTIFPEPAPRMGTFSIFIEGLSGETARIKAGDQDITLRKTLQLNYQVRGDEVFAGEDDVTVKPQEWVMR